MGGPKTSEAIDSDLTCVSSHWDGRFKSVSWRALAKRCDRVLSFGGFGVNWFVLAPKSVASNP